MGGRSDDDLLMSGDPEDFGIFYRRHARDLLRYFACRVRDPETAADLTAETFAAAIVARRRFRPGPAPAAAWLRGIAAHKLLDFQRHGAVEERARRRLGIITPALTHDDEELLRAVAERDVAQLLDVLPVDQREAVRARVLADESYDEMARRAGVPEPVLRQRVSRGLRNLRRVMGDEA